MSNFVYSVSLSYSGDFIYIRSNSNYYDYNKEISYPYNNNNIIVNIIKNLTTKENLIPSYTGGSNNKYKKTENIITVIYNKKKYTRIIYINESKKYVKINKTFMLLSKLKKI